MDAVMVECPVCGKHVKRTGLGGHKYLAHTTAGRAHTKKANASRRGSRGGTSWNAGLSKHTDERVAKYANALRMSDNVGHTHTDETRRKMSETKRKCNTGGAKPNSGRGKRGWYRGVHCMSSWELAFVVYNKDHNINVSRCTETRYYTFDGITRRYYPDFVIDGIVYEIKGYTTPQWEAKYQANPDIVVIDKTAIQPYISYVVSTYGKKFIELYEHMEDRVHGEQVDSKPTPTSDG